MTTVDEMSEQSFPASDPPASMVSLRAGPPVRPRPIDLARWIGVSHGAIWIASGLWPIVHYRSFEAVTGRKRDTWLVKTVGILVAVIGAEIARRTIHKRPASFLGASSALALAAIDVIYATKGRISKIYLVDAALEAALAGGWITVAGMASRNTR